MTYSDLANGTVFGNTGVGLVTTSNNGTSWSGASDIVGLLPNVVRAGPDWFYNFSSVDIAVDNSSASSHKGNIYLVWADNRTTTQTSGDPSVGFSMSTGAGFTSPTLLTSASSSTEYLRPDGQRVGVRDRVGQLLRGQHLRRGLPRLRDLLHRRRLHLVGSVRDLGQPERSRKRPQRDPDLRCDVDRRDERGRLRETGRTARASNCASGGNASTYLALVHPVAITTNAAAIVDATVTVGGVLSTFPLPAETGWDTNLSVVVSVPDWLATPNGSSIDEFASYSGAYASASNPVTFNYVGGSLAVNYAVTAASWIDGTVSPAAAGAHLTIVEISTSETVPGNLIKGSGVYSFNVTVPGSESYTVTASAPKYQTQSDTVGTTNHQVSPLTFVLAKEIGWIAGTVSASTGTTGIASAVLTVNDTAVPAADFNRTTGRFNVSEVWGTYYVNVTSAPSSAYLPYTPSSQVTVSVGSTVSIKAGLKGAWINGSITPYPVSVTINSVPVSLVITGNTATWVDPLPGGTYDIVAHEAGYSGYNETYTVPAGTDVNLTGTKGIVLTNHGSIQGTITPASNNGNVPTLFVNNGTESVLGTGQFSVTETASARAYNVSVHLLGYVTSDHQVIVTPGNISWLNVTMVKPVCTGSACPGGGGGNYCNQTPVPSNCTHGTNNNGLTTLDYVGIGVIVLLVVLIAAVMLMRRGKGGANAMPPGPTESSDASMGGSPGGQPSSSPEMGQDAGSTAPPASP